MIRLYWQNTYLMTHSAQITAIGQDEYGSYVRLNETIFHPQGGGQPSDEGTINNIRVVKLVDLREINEINHYLEDLNGLKVGDVVELKIDAEKRLEYAALHTAGHITAAVLRNNYQYKQQISANHFPNQAKVEFTLEGSTVSKDNLVQNVQHIIDAKLKVLEQYNEQGLRCIEIEGLCLDPCSGTHVLDTSLIEQYQIRKLENKKNKLTAGYSAKHKLNES